MSKITLTEQQTFAYGGDTYDTQADMTKAMRAVARATGQNQEGVNTVTIVVSGAPPPPPVKAAFEVSADGLTVTVNDQSTGAKTEVWNWGDGQTSDKLGGQQHAYGAGGTYTIVLAIAADDGTTDSTTRDVTVAAQQPPPGDPNIGVVQPDDPSYKPPSDA